MPVAPSARRVCVDTGGTFTDLIELDRGRLSVHKVVSTPSAPADAVLAALTHVGGGERGGRLVHGHTVGLNALLTGRGARVALVTNRGFEDLIEIGRQERPDIYALHVGPRPTLVPRALRFGIDERRLADGTLRSRASRDELTTLRTKLAHRRIDAIAICLLHSWAHPEDELRIARALRSLDKPLSLSSQLLRRHREFERFSTAIVNSFVLPCVGTYLDQLGAGAAPMDVQLVRNEGGTIRLDEVRNAPVRAIVSGPAGGAAGARFWAGEAGFERAVGFDMGGTSADVALCGGAATVEEETVLGSFPLALPSVPIASVGCGGGSIAYRDEGGALRVGPESAGADPGPACYGRGGEPTITDAHLALGRLPVWGLLGGGFPLHVDRAEAAVSRLAHELSLDVRATAAGILDIADLQMARPLRAFTLGRGVDPADVCLVAFGGAGGLHAARLAEHIGFREVLVPPHPGILSAAGMLLAREVHEEEQSLVVELDGMGIKSLLAGARSLLTQTQQRAPAPAKSREALAAVRYRGNNAEFWVPADRHACESFEAEFERRYGFRQDLPVECLRLRARLTLETDPRARVSKALAATQTTPTNDVATTLGPGGLPCRPRERTPRRWTKGPLAIVDYSGTTIVEEGWRVRRDELNCLRLRPQ